ncbi:MAG TPA: ABC transporter substrate-binding protein [Blastocatellia bacterium]|nr:ABC transporter substrate-binding protein [Blastocatellia bacterium]
MRPGTLICPRLLAAWLILVFLLPTFAQTEQPRYGGSVVIAVNDDPGGLNPAITTQGMAHLVSGSIFSGLVGIDFNLRPTPDLATRWEVAPDGKRYTFQLAPNAIFHDGKPVTSDDVKFTFEQLLLKYHSRTRASIGDKLRAISTPDPHTVVFEFATPYAAFLQLIDVANAPVMPKHLYENTDPLTNPHNSNPVGCGPFKFERWVKGDHVALRRNENYFRPGRPYLDRAVFKVMPSASSAAIALENGEADFLMNPSPLDVARFKLRSDIIVTDKGREAYATVETMVPNITRAPLSDLRVRQAVAHAIDRQYLVDKVQFGQARVATGPVSSLLAWAYNPNVTKYERDLARANQLLDEAGYKRGADGVRFHLKTLCSSGWVKTSEALRDQLREAGIALDLQLLEFSAMVEQTYIKKDFDLSFSSFENGPDPDIGVKRTVISSNIGPIPFSNGAGYRNQQIDLLFNAASSEPDQRKRVKLYFEAQEILTKELPYFWLYEPRSSSAYHAALRGVFAWSAKSNAQFARDAWWVDGKRPERATAGAGGGRRWYWLALVVVATLAVVGMLVRRSADRKRAV